MNSVEIVRLSKTASAAAVALNRTAALLICDLLDVLDRGVVFDMISELVGALRRGPADGGEPSQASRALVRRRTRPVCECALGSHMHARAVLQLAHLRFELLGTLARHDQFMFVFVLVVLVLVGVWRRSSDCFGSALNLPLPAKFCAPTTLKSDWLARHFLIGTLLDECELSLARDERALSRQVRRRAVRASSDD